MIKFKELIAEENKKVKSVINEGKNDGMPKTNLVTQNLTPTEKDILDQALSHYFTHLRKMGGKNAEHEQMICFEMVKALSKKPSKLHISTDWKSIYSE